MGLLSSLTEGDRLRFRLEAVGESYPGDRLRLTSPLGWSPKEAGDLLRPRAPIFGWSVQTPGDLLRPRVDLLSSLARLCGAAGEQLRRAINEGLGDAERCLVVLN